MEGLDVLGVSGHICGHLSTTAVLNEVAGSESTKDRTVSSSDPLPGGLTQRDDVPLNLCRSTDNMSRILLKMLFLFSHEVSVLHLEAKVLLLQLLLPGNPCSLWMRKWEITVETVAQIT